MSAAAQEKPLIIFKEFTGLRNDRPPERFMPTDLVSATNVDIDNSGMPARRAGLTQIDSVPRHSAWSDVAQTQMFAVETNTGHLVSFDNNFVSTTLRGMSSKTLPVSYSKANDRVYYSTEQDTGIIENGVSRSWGLPVPPLPGIVSVGAGSMPAGTYQFVLTYMRTDGQESGAGLAGVVAIPDQSGITFSLPASTDPQIAGMNLYISTPDGATMYLAGTVTATATQVTYLNDTSELNFPLQTQFLSPSPPGQLAVYYRGHMFIAVGDTIYPSEPYAYELFDLRKGFSLDGKVTLLAPLEDKERPGLAEGMDSGFFVGTTRSCGILVGKDPTGFQYVPKVNYGAIAGTLAMVDGSLFGADKAGARLLPMWLTTEGICVGLPQMEVNNITRTRYRFKADGTGAALFIPGPNRLILTCNY